VVKSYLSIIKNEDMVYVVATFSTVFNVFNFLLIHFAFSGFAKEGALLAIILFIFLVPIGFIFSVIGLIKKKNATTKSTQRLMLICVIINSLLIVRTLVFLNDSSNFHIM